MTFDRAIKDIMPHVQEGSDEPFIIYRNTNGSWQVGFTQNQYGERYDWIDDIEKFDPFAFEYTGKIFTQSSYASVHDNILCNRLRMEFEFNNDSGVYSGTTFEDQVLGMDEEEAEALLNFFEDNVISFSNRSLNYLISANRPFTALTEMYPFNIQSNDENSLYNKDLAQEAINHIEKEIKKRLGIERDKPINKRIIDDYEELHNIKLGGVEIFVGGSTKSPGLYMICDIKQDNLFGLDEHNNIIYSDDYLYTMREFSQRIDKIAIDLTSQRNKTKLPDKPLTTTECLPDSQQIDWEGKLIVIKPEILAPEYRSMEHQLVLCTGGFGASPNARGRAVHIKELLSDKHLRYDRHQIAGIADTTKIPKWALDRLLKEIIIGNPDVIKDNDIKPIENKPTLANKLENAKNKAKALNTNNIENKNIKRKGSEVR